MIKMRIYAVYDRVALEVVGTLLMMYGHDAVCIRQMVDVVSKGDSVFNKNPQDYVLRCYGELVSEGEAEPKMIAFDPPQLVCEVAVLVNPQGQREEVSTVGREGLSLSPN